MEVSGSNISYTLTTKIYSSRGKSTPRLLQTNGFSQSFQEKAQLDYE